MDKIEFGKLYYPLASNAGNRFGMNPIDILAQSAQETGWGESYGAKVRKNFFGITASGPVNQYWDGSYNVSTVSGLKFRTYKTAQDSFYDFARLITSKYKEEVKFSQAGDSLGYAKAIALSPYISETNGDNRSDYQRNVASNAQFLNGVLQDVIAKDILDRKKKDLFGTSQSAC